MRVALVAHGLPPGERTGVETHVAALARALAARGARVLVVAPRSVRALPHLAERREPREGFEVRWLNLVHPARDPLERERPPGVEAALVELLERERPEVVHVHHWAKLGLAALEACARAGIPALYTAHDYHFVCHRATLLRPDLARCGRPGEVEACARCDLAQELLEAQPELGDFQAGAFPDQLDAAARAELARLLDEAPGDEAQALRLQRARERRAELHALRARALASFRLVLAPTERMAASLRRAGLAAERVRVLPYAVDAASLASLPPPAVEPGDPLRFGFVGGLAKHKGAHVLLEAFRGLAGEARLEVFGGGSDLPYLERVRALCAEVGASFRGPFDAPQLPRVLGALDVVCVPSLWEENAPFVIREAFAAGRPVLASRTDALAESVREGRDGLLLPPGDVEAWREALRSLAPDPERVRRLAEGVRPPPSLDAQAGELLALYAEIAADARPLAQELPEHLREFAATRERALREPLDDLHARVAAGLARLRAGLLGERVAPEPASAALETARDLLRDARRELDWLRAQEAAAAAERARAGEERAWLRARLAAREAEVAWRRAQERALRDELDWRRAVDAAREEELAWLRRSLAEGRAALEALEAERDWLAELRAALERERDALPDLRAQLEALAAHELWLRGEARALAAALAAAGEPTHDGPADPAQVARDLAAARERLAALQGELAWRREQMHAALDEGGEIFRALLGRSGLGRRMAGWRGPGSARA